MYMDGRRRKLVTRWMMFTGYAVLAGTVGVSSYWYSLGPIHKAPDFIRYSASFDVKGEVVEAPAISSAAKSDSSDSSSASGGSLSSGFVGSPVAAPEPASLMLLAPGALLLARKRSRKA